MLFIITASIENMNKNYEYFASTASGVAAQTAA